MPAGEMRCKEFVAHISSMVHAMHSTLLSFHSELTTNNDRVVGVCVQNY